MKNEIILDCIKLLQTINVLALEINLCRIIIKQCLSYNQLQFLIKNFEVDYYNDQIRIHGVVI